MKKLQISLKPGERIYVNGAVLKVDRKVSIEFLNDVTFLLEHHVIHPDDTKTPLRQLYFIIQTVLIDPANSGDAHAMFYQSLASLDASVDNAAIREGLTDVRDFFDRGRPFDALKVLRSLFPVEESILSQSKRKEPGTLDQHPTH